MRVLALASAVLSLSISGLAWAESPPPLVASVAPPATPAPAPSVKPRPARPHSAAPAPLPPPSAERLELGRRVIEAQGGAFVYAGVLDNMVDGLEAGLKPSPVLLDKVAPYKTRFMTSVHAHVPELMEALATAWAQAYSEEEMRGQLAYLESPIARGAAARAPRIAGDLGRELGWFGRQILLTDPKGKVYLADPGPAAGEPPPQWDRPSPRTLEMVRDMVAKAGGAALLKSPGAVMDKTVHAGPGGKQPSPAMARLRSLLPQLISDVMVIVADNYTRAELDAQTQFMDSAAGKATTAKRAQLGAAFSQNVKPVMGAVLMDLKAPSGGH